MRIVLIGFSGSGKSHWSRLLAQSHGYQHICCDDLIEEKLREFLPSSASGINDVAEWMGQPYDQRFKRNETRYLQCEKGVLEEILKKPDGFYPDRTVLDTTGSVIYTGDRLTRQLSLFGRVVYLEVTPAVLAEMFQEYINNPKPVIWGESFTQHPGESPMEALKRCYPELLKYRQSRYEQLAEVSLGYNETRMVDFGPDEFLAAVNPMICN
jgi:shikimate kinase